VTRYHITETRNTQYKCCENLESQCDQILMVIEGYILEMTLNRQEIQFRTLIGTKLKAYTVPIKLTQANSVCLKHTLCFLNFIYY
jgi:hypothetical protein